MLAHISEKLTNRLIRRNVIGDDDRDIYQYGMEQLFRTVINITTTIILGIALGELWQSIVFVTAFIAIRSYAGGYHVETPFKCYLLTTLIVTATLSVMKYIQIDHFICIGLLVISSGLILLLSPVESENKPLDNMEQMIYRKKAIIAWGIETLIAMAALFLSFNKIFQCIVMAEVVLSLSLVIGILKAEIKKRMIKA